uniref:Uncharacterized protein n=1 Tax=Rhizophora mucronata TaxID=61149 RepID=A0A2P2PFM0_RHIMU
MKIPTKKLSRNAKNGNKTPITKFPC